MDHEFRKEIMKQLLEKRSQRLSESEPCKECEPTIRTSLDVRNAIKTLDANAKTAARHRCVVIEQ
jgi:DUF1009 family protein